MRLRARGEFSGEAAKKKTCSQAVAGGSAGGHSRARSHAREANPAPGFPSLAAFGLTRVHGGGGVKAARTRAPEGLGLDAFRTEHAGRVRCKATLTACTASEAAAASRAEPAVQFDASSLGW